MKHISKAGRKETLWNTRKTLTATLASVMVALGGCASNTGLNQLPQASIYDAAAGSSSEYRYLIGPGDNLNVFVWGNPEVSGSFVVRPDGMITTYLVEDIKVSGKTTTQVAREVEKALSQYIRDPIVSVSLSGFVGPFSEQVRVIGEAAEPRALNYTEKMTLLDVIIAVNGLTEFASGNSASLLRVEDGEYKRYALRMEDLISNGDITANVDILPGDIILIPEAWF